MFVKYNRISRDIDKTISKFGGPSSVFESSDNIHFELIVDVNVFQQDWSHTVRPTTPLHWFTLSIMYFMNVKSQIIKILLQI